MIKLKSKLASKFFDKSKSKKNKRNKSRSRWRYINTSRSKSIVKKIKLKIRIKQMISITRLIKQFQRRIIIKQYWIIMMIML